MKLFHTIYICAQITLFILSVSPTIDAAKIVPLSDDPFLIHRVFEFNDAGKKLLGLGPDDDLELIREVKGFQKTYFRFRQLHRGVPLYKYQILIAIDESHKITNIGGHRVDDVDEDLIGISRNRKSTSKALQIVKNNFLKQNRTAQKNKWSFENEHSEFVIHIDSTNKARYAFETSFFAINPTVKYPTNPLIIIDAQNMLILEQYENLKFENGQGPGGNLKTGKYEYGQGNKPFLDVYVEGNTASLKIPNGVETYNMNHFIGNPKPNQLHTFTFPRNTHKEINGGYCPLNDAHYAGTITSNMYLDWFGTSPFPNTIIIPIAVHWGTNIADAFCNTIAIFLGDGNDNYYPFTSLDIVAHEAGHAFVHYYSKTMSGGMDEAYCDLAGEAAEFYAHGNNDWLHAANVPKHTQAIRYFIHPTLDGKSIDHRSKFINNPDSDPHLSAGIMNRAAYLLATTPGWNTKMAFELFTWANKVYFNQFTKFDNCVSGLFAAADDYQYSKLDIANAFAQVGIFTGYYKITAKHSGKVLDVSNASMENGANVHQWEYVGNNNQVWSIQYVDDQYCKIISVNSGKVLDVSDESKANGANVHQWEYVGNDNQLWKLTILPDGYFIITAKHSQKALDVQGASQNNGGNVIQYDYHGGTNQQWSIERVGPLF